MTLVALVSTIAAALLGAVLVPLIMPSSVQAETRLVVGVQSLGAQTVPGYAQATVALAETYARFVTVDTLKSVKAGTLTDLQATVIPDNPVVRILATARNEKDARAGAAAAAKELIKSVAEVTGSTLDATRATFLTKRAATAKAEANAAQLKAQIEANPNSSQALNDTYLAAINTAALARLESAAYERILQTQLEAGADQSSGLRVIMEPRVSSTVSKPMLLGALLGSALSVLLWGGVSLVRQARRRDPAQVAVAQAAATQTEVTQTEVTQTEVTQTAVGA